MTATPPPPLRPGAAGKRVLLVGGPAIVHTGAGPYLAELVRDGYVNAIFAGNALAVHDIESQFFGTSLGVNLEDAFPAEEGHVHHLRTVNRIRAVGGIRNAIDQGMLSGGIMYEAFRKDIPVVLCGSIRDDGPLSEVITDVMACQRAMRHYVPEIGMALMVCTLLHSIAVGNLLPASCKTVCVDINPQLRGQADRPRLAPDSGYRDGCVVVSARADPGDRGRRNGSGRRCRAQELSSAR